MINDPDDTARGRKITEILVDKLSNSGLAVRLESDGQLVVCRKFFGYQLCSCSNRFAHGSEYCCLEPWHGNVFSATGDHAG